VRKHVERSSEEPSKWRLTYEGSHGHPAPAAGAGSAPRALPISASSSGGRRGSEPRPAPRTGASPLNPAAGERDERAAAEGLARMAAPHRGGGEHTPPAKPKMALPQLQMPKEIDMAVPMSMSPGMAALMQAAAAVDCAAPAGAPPLAHGHHGPGGGHGHAGGHHGPRGAHVPDTPHSMLDPLNCLSTPRNGLAEGDGGRGPLPAPLLKNVAQAAQR
jgi:hypothetical protein